jgi:hypothetical protein
MTILASLAENVDPASRLRNALDSSDPKDVLVIQFELESNDTKNNFWVRLKLLDPQIDLSHNSIWETVNQHLDDSNIMFVITPDANDNERIIGIDFLSLGSASIGFRESTAHDTLSRFNIYRDLFHKVDPRNIGMTDV